MLNCILFLSDCYRIIIRCVLKFCCVKNIDLENFNLNISKLFLPTVSNSYICHKKIIKVFRKKIFAFVLFFAICGTAFSQHEIYQVRGKLVDPNNNPIQFAHVVNINKSSACISDTAGWFRILMLRTDTVKISCLGFDVTGFSLKDLNLGPDERHVEIGVVTMQPKLYELETVDVYKERWKSFLYDYQNIDVAQETETEKNIERWKNNLLNVNELQQIARASRGTGFAMNFDFKRKKAEKKINESKRQDELNQEAYEKYNPQIISGITGMSIEESEKFMFHFNLDRDFILRRNDYDIYLIITQLYKEYKNN